MPDVELRIGGQIHEGWLSARVTRSLEQIASSFQLELTERTGGDTALPVIRGGVACRVDLQGEAVITGFVDEVGLTVGDSSAMTVAGRSRAGDLVDCTAEHPSGRWTNTELATIARDLCKPFSVSVSAPATPPFAAFALEQGESVFAALERLARYRGLLVTSTAQGNIVIGSAGVRRVPAVLDDNNVLKAESRVSMTERFSAYTVKGQQAGDDDNTPEDSAQASASSKDAGVWRHRPLTVIAEEQADLASLQTRADWERAVRAGRSKRLNVTVQGWRVNGVLWQPNHLVQVRLPRLRINETLLIVSVTHALSSQSGTVTELQLCPRVAYDVLAEPEPTDDEDWS